MINKRNKATDMFRFRWILACLPIIFLFGWFFLATTTPLNKFLADRPFVSEVNGIATDGSNVYTLDETFHTICKYDESGTLLYCMKYSSWASNFIFCNEIGQLCRYEARSHNIYVYDSDGTMIDRYKVAESEIENVDSSET